jgi:hypothetical protein
MFCYITEQAAGRCLLKAEDPIKSPITSCETRAESGI